MDDYGVYTAADANFFPGVVVQINALRLHGYFGKLAVIDTGLDEWMRTYLVQRGVVIISMDFVKDLRFTDVLSDETAGMRGWSFKAFGIMQARLFKCFTYIDADYIPLCNPQQELHERIRTGEFLCTEDGQNTWDEAHTEAIGVQAGSYMNINAGFFSASMEHHGAILEEWRNLMTRRKPFELWYGDQGALNAILDKYGIEKVLVGDKSDWNQTWLNERYAKEDSIAVASFSPPVLIHGDGRRIFGWHGCGWCRYWHCIGIDHFRTSKAEIDKMRQECVGKIPDAVLDIFSWLLFHDGDLVVTDHRIGPSRGAPSCLSDLYESSCQSLTDKGTAHSYPLVYDRLLAPYRETDGTLVEIGVYRGGSLLLWAEFFESATIVGIDINLANVLASVLESPRIKLIEGNATNTDLVNQYIDAVDIVIDDGSHAFEDQLGSFRALVPKLTPGGLYIIEDILCHENAMRLQREIAGSQIIDRRHVKGRADDILLVYTKPT